MMPVHNLRCNNCGRKWEDIVNPSHLPPCPDCGSDPQITFDWGTLNIDVFKPFVDMGFAYDTPTFVESKQQLADHCKKKGLISQYLKGGYKSYRAKKEI